MKFFIGHSLSLISTCLFGVTAMLNFCKDIFFCKKAAVLAAEKLSSTHLAKWYC